MSMCGQADDDNGSETGAPVRELYEQKAVSTVVRVLTVLAYLLSVSLAAILLSVYYVCVWKSPELPKNNETEMERHQDQEYTHSYLPDIQNIDGGSDIPVNEITSDPTASSSDQLEPIEPTGDTSSPNFDTDPSTNEISSTPWESTLEASADGIGATNATDVT